MVKNQDYYYTEHQKRCPDATGNTEWFSIVGWCTHDIFHCLGNKGIVNGGMEEVTERTPDINSHIITTMSCSSKRDECLELCFLAKQISVIHFVDIVSSFIYFGPRSAHIANGKHSFLVQGLQHQIMMVKKDGSLFSLDEMDETYFGSLD